MTRAQVAAMLERYRVTSGKRFRLADHDPDDHTRFGLDKAQGRALLAESVTRLSALQGRLYADGRWALLAVFQAMDAAGKDSTIRHVMSGVNPQGVQVTSFKQPGPDELTHDFLWRIHQAVPARGRIGVFNRSHYEEVLVVRVHPDMLARQHLPGDTTGHRFWRRRLKDIAQFEAYLGRQGIQPVKVFLNVSRAEQRRRFLDRLDEPDKHWKFSAADLTERALWDSYQDAYEDAIARTATPHAPWYVVPADAKWFTQLVVAEAMIAALAAMDLHVPEQDARALEAQAEARRTLEEE